MNSFSRFIIRAGSLILALVLLWQVSALIAKTFDRQVPLFFTILTAYLIVAYLILPRLIHLSSTISRRGHIPRFTRSPDGLPADPINVAVICGQDKLKETFASIGWHAADPLTIRSIWKMIIAFVFKRPYPNAPFSTLLLFARRPDLEFQKPINNNPRQRHHIRFWGIDTETLPHLHDYHFWNQKQNDDACNNCMWLGAVTKDTGFGLTSFTFQISHQVDADVDEEREYLISELASSGLLKTTESYNTGAFKVGKYISDGKIVTVRLN